ncbi:MAG: hypothetical protein ABIH65_03990 [Nanoarchaeota archaeon]
MKKTKNYRVTLRLSDTLYNLIKENPSKMIRNALRRAYLKRKE